MDNNLEFSIHENLEEGFVEIKTNVTSVKMSADKIELRVGNVESK